MRRIPDSSRLAFRSVQIYVAISKKRYNVIVSVYDISLKNVIHEFMFCSPYRNLKLYFYLKSRPVKITLLGIVKVPIQKNMLSNPGVVSETTWYERTIESTM